jgi:hypothetical protein
MVTDKLKTPPVYNAVAKRFQDQANFGLIFKVQFITQIYLESNFLLRPKKH